MLQFGIPASVEASYAILGRKRQRDWTGKSSSCARSKKGNGPEKKVPSVVQMEQLSPSLRREDLLLEEVFSFLCHCKHNRESERNRILCNCKHSRECERDRISIQRSVLIDFLFLQAVVFLHGGPGSGTSSGNRRFFDPDFYRIVLFDQVREDLVVVG
jgi:hypothetical protein